MRALSGDVYFWSGFGVGVEDRRTGNRQQATGNSNSNSNCKDEIRGFFASLRMTTVLDDSRTSTKRL
jgi:hypothetical protein